MSKNLIDTNLIIRFLINDDPKKVERVEKLLKDKNNTNILLDPVIAEIIWVLSSYYTLQKQDVVEKVRALIHVNTIECNEVVVNRALTIWEQHNISYIDAYIASVAELGQIQLYTYDKKFNSISLIKVREP